MYDLNDAPEQRDGGDQVDLDALSDALAACADRWVPLLFQQGRIVDGVLRVADISGAPPRKEGSCHIQLRGDHAGSWFDHSLNRGGGPLSTIKEHLGLSGRELIAEARRILAEAGVSVDRTTRQRGDAQRASESPSHLAEAGFEWLKRKPLAGTLGEIYFRNRGITQIPECDDLGFSDDVVNFKTKIGGPGIIARFRRPDGTLTGGIHRIWLKPDGSWHDGKKMLGPVDGAVIMLGLPDAAGALGVGEGIETTLAAAQMFGVPGWAAASDGGMKKLAAWLIDNPDGAKALGIKRLLVWADAGKAGKTAGEALCTAARSVGIEAELFLPRGGDDFADDLANGRSPIDAARTAAGEVLLQSGDIEAMIREQLSENSGPDEIARVIDAMVGARLGPLWDGPLLSNIKDRTKAKMPALIQELKASRARLTALDQSSQQPTTGSALTAIDWRSNLQINIRTHEPKPITANVYWVILGNWPSVVAFNEFSDVIMVLQPPPWHTPAAPFEERPWTDEDTQRATLWAQHVEKIPASQNIVFDGIMNVALNNKYHPVRQYLDSLVWDKESRLDRWLTYYCGVDPNAYVEAVGSRWLISAVARVYRPGCKADCCLILEGNQGIGKSTVFLILAIRDEWFTDEIADLGSKDAAIQTRGKWIVELAELDAFRKADVSRQKSYMSRGTDHFRPPYGRSAVDVKRQYVFAGSVNDSQYLNDPTGGRRFWGVWAKNIDLEALKRDRDQLWAEAVHRFRAGEPWYLDDPEVIALAETEQAGRYNADAWEDVIRDWLRREAKRTVTVSDILQNALGITDKSKWTRADQMRVAATLKHLKWTRKQIWLGKGLQEW